MAFLYECVVTNTAMSTILQAQHNISGVFCYPMIYMFFASCDELQHFLANSGVSRSFAEILLGFLVGKLTDVFCCGIDS